MADPRAFGYIYGPGDGNHQFFAIKTEKAVSVHIFLHLIIPVLLF